MARNRSNIFNSQIVTRLDKDDLPGLQNTTRKTEQNLNIMLNHAPLKSVESGLQDKYRKYFTHPDYQATAAGTVLIYTDGSTIANGQRGAKSGYGVFFAKENLMDKNLSRRVPRLEKQTNNVAELMAIHEAIHIGKDLPGRPFLKIYSDSNYAIDVVTGKKNASKNTELIDGIKALLRITRVDFTHVYAHTSKQDIHSIGNDIADYLAGQGSSTA
jgi:ribonuclease HI